MLALAQSAVCGAYLASDGNRVMIGEKPSHPIDGRRAGGDGWDWR